MNGRRQDYPVTRHLDLIQISRLDHAACVSAFLREVYHGTKAAFTSFRLDFSRVQVAFPNACAPLAGLLHFYTGEGLEFSVYGTLPQYVAKTCLMKPCCPTTEQTQMNAASLDRVWRFGPDEVSPLVTAMVREFSRSVTCEKGVLQAFEWALNEVMDNVIQHSGTPCGFAMAQVHRHAKHMAVCVFDCGQGIFNSLKTSVHAPRNPVDAISLSLKEGVTRNSSIGQGNGLWGLYRIVTLNKGILNITSSSASWMMADTNVRTFDRLPFPSHENGSTTVDFQLDTGSPVSLSVALRGKSSAPQVPTSIYMEQFETDSDFLRYCLQEQTSGTGTRKSGERIRNEILNMLASQKRPVILDFDGLAIVSSSFADELVGKLMVALGFVDFNRTIHLRNMNDETKAIIERSVAQRMMDSIGCGGSNNGTEPIR